MFSSITSYLWGTGEEPAQTDEPQASQPVPESTEDVSSPAEETVLEESPANTSDWVVVDAKGNSETMEMEISPMENLLIEHPSMSVYNHGSMVHSGSASEESNQSDTSTDVVPRKLRPRKTQVATRQGSARPRVVSAKNELMQQIDAVKCAQKVEHYNKTRRVSRKNLKKINQVNEVKSTGKIHGKSNRVRIPSGQMCGRIPQRKN